MASEPEVEVTPTSKEPPKVIVLPDEPEIPRTALEPTTTTTTSRQVTVELPSTDSLTATVKGYLDIAAPVAVALGVVVATLWLKRRLSHDEDTTDHGISK